MGQIIKLFSRESKKDEDNTVDQKEEESFDFLSIEEQNKKKKERLEKERSQKNRSVLRSYRLKS